MNMSTSTYVIRRAPRPRAGHHEHLRTCLDASPRVRETRSLMRTSHGLGTLQSQNVSMCNTTSFASKQGKLTPVRSVPSADFPPPVAMQHFGDRDPAYCMQDASVQYNYRSFGPKGTSNVGIPELLDHFCSRI